MKINLYIFAFLCLIILTQCGQGLDPIDPSHLQGTARITGIINFKGGKGAWPPASDSVNQIRVACFKKYPPDNIIQTITSGDAYFMQASTLLNVDTANFSIDIPDVPIEIKYIVVAEQYSSSILNWRAVGVYTITGDMNNPTSIYVQPGQTYQIILNVDFKNLPITPF